MEKLFQGLVADTGSKDDAMGDAGVVGDVCFEVDVELEICLNVEREASTECDVVKEDNTIDAIVGDVIDVCVLVVNIFAVVGFVLPAEVEEYHIDGNSLSYLPCRSFMDIRFKRKLQVPMFRNSVSKLLRNS